MRDAGFVLFLDDFAELLGGIADAVEKVGVGPTAPASGDKTAFTAAKIRDLVGKIEGAARRLRDDPNADDAHDLAVAHANDVLVETERTLAELSTEVHRAVVLRQNISEEDGFTMTGEIRAVERDPSLRRAFDVLGAFSGAFRGEKKAGT